MIHIVSLTLSSSFSSGIQVANRRHKLCAGARCNAPFSQTFKWCAQVTRSRLWCLCYMQGQLSAHGLQSNKRCYLPAIVRS